MKKLLTLTAVFACFNASAADWIADNGKYYGADFAMQNELDQAAYVANEKMQGLAEDIEGVTASMSAMSMLSEEQGAVSVATGYTKDSYAVAVGYSDKISEKVNFRVGAQTNNTNQYSVGVGLSYKLK